eukprot:3420606-Rhodomonas_salina.5
MQGQAGCRRRGSESESAAQALPSRCPGPARRCESQWLEAQPAEAEPGPEAQSLSHPAVTLLSVQVASASALALACSQSRAPPGSDRDSHCQ